MSESSTEFDEKYNRLPIKNLPTENVTSTEYGQALANLVRFAALDIAKLRSLQDLGHTASTIGRDVGTVVLTKGRIQNEEYKLDRVIGNSNVVVTLFGWDTVSSGKDLRLEIDKFDIKGKGNTGDQISGFHIVLFANKNLGEPNYLLHFPVLPLAAVRRLGKFEMYSPGLAPNSPEVQQGFASLLQEAVRELLPILEPPSEIPRLFNY
jgi:hypothetical protein